MKSTWKLAAALMLAASLGLAGCSGDDGRDGTDGAAGPVGPIGPEGPGGPPGDSVQTMPIETCAVCHDDGSYASATAAHALTEMAAFDEFDVAEVGPDLVITFSATVDGAPAAIATFQHLYSWDGDTRITLTPGTTFANDNGDITLTVSAAALAALSPPVTLTPATNARYLAILRAGGVNNLEVVAYGDYPSGIPLAGLASDQACIDCHGPSGEVGRFAPTRASGHYSAPMSVEACVVCHRPAQAATSYGSMVQLAHGIHNSHNFPGGDGFTLPAVNRTTVYDVTYPTYMTNCSVCHREEIVPSTGLSGLETVNAMPVTGQGCLSCHGSMEGFGFSEGLAFHLSIADPTADGACTTCHNGSLARDTVSDYHNGLVTARGGIIWDGVDTSVTEGAKIDMQITAIVDDGTNLAVSWTADYEGVGGVNPCNETLGPTAPLFHLGAGPPNANLSLLRSYAQGDDFIIGMNANKPGQALAVNVTADNTTCASNVATTTIPVDDVEAERGIVALQGKPRVAHANPANTAPMQVRAFTPTREWVVGSGALPLVERRPVVASQECLKCHVGSMYQHGGNRIDNVDMCIMCHNPAAVEQDVRMGFFGVDATTAYDGKVGETYEMKTMVHAVHSAGVTGAPYVLYRQGQGVFAWAQDAAILNNWSGGAACTLANGNPGRIVVGSNPERCAPHTFHNPTYPRALNACAACHTSDFDVLPNQTKAMALTVDAGSAENFRDQTDDVLKGASAAACMSCHSSGDSFMKNVLDAHAYQFGWTPQAFPEGRQTIIDAAD